MAINTSMGKDRDCIARFLLPSHVNSLKGSKLFAKLAPSEETLASMWTCCRAEVRDNSLAEHVATQVMGKAMCRVLLWVLDLGKKSVEMTEHPFFQRSTLIFSARRFFLARGVF